jgi:hypothetical protein
MKSVPVVAGVMTSEFGDYRTNSGIPTHAMLVITISWRHSIRRMPPRWLRSTRKMRSWTHRKGYFQGGLVSSFAQEKDTVDPQTRQFVRSDFQFRAKHVTIRIRYASMEHSTPSDPASWDSASYRDDPIDHIEPSPEQVKNYRECARRLLRVLSVLDHWMCARRDCPPRDWVTASIALGLPSTRGQTETEIVAAWGLTRAAVSKDVCTVLRLTRTDPAFGLKSNIAKRGYRVTNAVVASSTTWTTSIRSTTDRTPTAFSRWTLEQISFCAVNVKLSACTVVPRDDFDLQRVRLVHHVGNIVLARSPVAAPALSN